MADVTLDPRPRNPSILELTSSEDEVSSTGDLRARKRKKKLTFDEKPYTSRLKRRTSVVLPNQDRFTTPEPKRAPRTVPEGKTPKRLAVRGERQTKSATWQVLIRSSHGFRCLITNCGANGRWSKALQKGHVIEKYYGKGVFELFSKVTARGSPFWHWVFDNIFYVQATLHIEIDWDNLILIPTPEGSKLIAKHAEENAFNEIRQDFREVHPRTKSYKYYLLVLNEEEVQQGDGFIRLSLAEDGVVEEEYGVKRWKTVDTRVYQYSRINQGEAPELISHVNPFNVVFRAGVALGRSQFEERNCKSLALKSPIRDSFRSIRVAFNVWMDELAPAERDRLLRPRRELEEPSLPLNVQGSSRGKAGQEEELGSDDFIEEEEIAQNTAEEEVKEMEAPEAEVDDVRENEEKEEGT